MKGKSLFLALLLVPGLVFNSAYCAEKLTGAIAYNMRQIGPRLEKAEKLLEAGDKHSAQSSYDTAKQSWDSILKDFKGQYDPKHPEIVAMQKRFDAIEARLKGGSAQPEPTPAVSPPSGPSDQAPPAAMAYSMKQVQANLDKTGQLLDQGDAANAASNLNSAKTIWETLKKDYDGKFDPNHPDVATLDQRFVDLRAKLSAAGAAKSASTPESAPPGTKGKAPPAAMLYVMKQIDENLDAAQKDIDAMNLNSAQSYFVNAEMYWEAQKKDYKGQYDPAHPTVVALEAKYQRIEKKLQGIESRASDATKSLPMVLAAIEKVEKKINEANQKARASARDVSSLMGDYDRGMEKDVDKLRLKVAELRERSETVNALLPEAYAAATAFRKQYPDFNEVERLVPNGWQATQAVERVEKFPDLWLSEGSRLVNEAISMAESNIKQFSVDRLKALAGQDKTIQTSTADNAEFYVVELSTFLLDVIPSIFPELPKEAQNQLPQFAKERQDSQKRVFPLRQEIQRIGAEIGKIRQEVVDAEKRKLERARFPKTEYTGGEWNVAKKEISKAYAEVVKDKKLIKMSIYLPWEIRSEARWRNDRWIVGTYRYIGANILAKLPDGKYRVYRMTFRNTKQPNGSWSPLKHWSVGHSYEILEANINK